MHSAHLISSSATPIGHSYQLEIINREKLEAGNVMESRVIPDEFADNSSDWNRD